MEGVRGGGMQRASLFVLLVAPSNHKFSGYA